MFHQAFPVFGSSTIRSSFFLVQWYFLTEFHIQCGASDLSWIKASIHSQGSRYSKSKLWTFPWYLTETESLLNWQAIKIISNDTRCICMLTLTIYSHAIAREASMSLLFWMDRWLPIAHAELKPANCLSTSFFDSKPLTAVSVYSKSEMLRNGAQGRSVIIL